MGSILSKAGRRCPKAADSLVTHRPPPMGNPMGHQPGKSTVPEMNPDILHQLKEMGPLTSKPLDLEGVPQSILTGGGNTASELGNSKNLNSEEKNKMGNPQMPKNRYKITNFHSPKPMVGRLTERDVQHLFVTTHGSVDATARDTEREKHRLPVSLYNNLLRHYRAPTLKTDKDDHHFAVGIWDKD